MTSQPVINGDSITFSVSSDSVSERLSALVPTITVSENATVSPASGSAVDFSQGSVTFTVTAQDGVTTRAYFAKAVTDTAGAWDLTALVPTIEVSQGATVTPASGSAIDLSNGKSVTFTVVAENGTENTYTVSASGSIYFYDENGDIIDQQDLGTVNAVLYEVSSEDETLNGENIYTSEAICATGSFETAGAADFTEFSFDLNYVKDYDPAKTYKLAVIFAASKEGNQYRAA